MQHRLVACFFSPNIILPLKLEPMPRDIRNTYSASYTCNKPESDYLSPHMILYSL